MQQPQKVLAALGFLLFLIGGSRAGQLPIWPIFSPCEFPTPNQPQQFYESCNVHARFDRLPWLCDLHRQLEDAYESIVHVESVYNRYKPVLFSGNRSNIAVVLVRQIEPFNRADIEHGGSRFRCVSLPKKCARTEQDIFFAINNNARMLLKVYAWALYERWFAHSPQAAPAENLRLAHSSNSATVDNECNPGGSPHILILIVVDGFLNDARKIPYVAIHSTTALLSDTPSDNRLRLMLGNIEMETTNAIVQNLPLQQTLSDLLTDIGEALLEWHSGEPRDHSVPRWARHLFILCVALVAIALAVEWYIVRRKLAVKKSPSGIKIVSGKSKTHLMF